MEKDAMPQLVGLGSSLMRGVLQTVEGRKAMLIVRLTRVIEECDRVGSAKRWEGMTGHWSEKADEGTAWAMGEQVQM